MGSKVLVVTAEQSLLYCYHPLPCPGLSKPSLLYVDLEKFSKMNSRSLMLFVVIYFLFVATHMLCKVLVLDILFPDLHTYKLGVTTF
jgi:hypothetical protein